MNAATFRFYADLSFFLPPQWQQVSFPYPTYAGDQTAKHLIESIGVPHTEVGLILANGEPADFDYLVQADDRVSVYPAFTTLETPRPLRPPPPNPAQFLLDNHLGKLARYLRLLGFDTLYFNNRYDDAQLAQMSQDLSRILLSRDRGLLKRSAVIYGYCLRTTDSEAQALAVLHRYDLFAQIRPWTRCLRCNGRLQPVAKEAIIDRLEPKTKLYFEEFQMCRACGQIYWRGSHFGPLQAFVEKVRQQQQAAHKGR